MYCDNQYYELCGQMGHLIGPSGIGKGQLPNIVETIYRTFVLSKERQAVSLMARRLIARGEKPYRQKQAADSN